MDTVKEYIEDLQQTLTLLSQEAIHEAVGALHEARMRRGQIFILGNGGSASTATHFVCDLAKNTRTSDRPHFRVHGLTDNMALITAYANDEGYENVFVQHLACFLEPGDVVVGISTSGNSANVLEAVRFANDKNARTIGFTGFDGGQLKGMVDISLHVPSDCIEQVEDIHLMFEHVIITALRHLPIQGSLDEEPSLIGALIKD